MILKRILYGIILLMKVGGMRRDKLELKIALNITKERHFCKIFFNMSC